MATLSVDIPDDLLARLEGLALWRETSVESLVVETLADYLDALEAPLGEVESTARGSNMLPRGATIRINSGDQGLQAVDDIDVSVPDRADGRQNWHREQHAVASFLRHLLAEHSALFPADLVRSDSPDFILMSKTSHRMLAIEHTDFGSHRHQRALDAEALQAEEGLVFVGNGDGWVGDEPEQSWAADLRAAIERKAVAKSWRNAGQHAERWLLLYDNTEVVMLVQSRSLRSLASRVLSEVHGVEQPEVLAIVRGSHEVIVVRRPAG